MFDAGIVGAGIVGCAIAREVAARGLSVVVIEKNPEPCRETSALNSRVIHSGFHEIPGTLKARLAAEGSRQIIQYAETHGVPLLPTGMLIAIPHGGIQAGLWRDTRALWDLWRAGRRQDVAFRFVFTAGAVREIAPIRAVGGIFIPSVRVISVEDVAAGFVADAKAAGARFELGREIVSISPDGTSHRIETSIGEIKARTLINAAGLGAHEISSMAGGPAYPIEFIRGDYYELLGGVARWGIRTLVYPAMPPHSKSKGIHFGPRTDGRLFLGPSATPVAEQAPKQLFLDAARKFLPEIRDTDLRWAYAGVRPKSATNTNKSDFTIRLDRLSPPLINLIGIDSPGLSASMAIARHVTKIVMNPE